MLFLLLACGPGSLEDPAKQHDTAAPDGPTDTADTTESGDPPIAKRDDTATSGTSEPVETGDTAGGDSDGLEGRTWALDLEAAVMSEPAGIGAVFARYLVAPLLMQARGEGAGTFDVRLGWGDGAGDQDTCLLTADVQAHYASPPVFTTDPGASSVEIAGHTMAVEDLTLTGTFTEGERDVRGGTLRFLGQTADLAPLVDDSANPEALCEFAEDFGDACEPCADGSPTCMRFELTRIAGSEVTPLALDEVLTDCP